MASTTERANPRHLMTFGPRIATPTATAFDTLSFKYVIGTYDTIVNGKVVKKVETEATAILDNFFLNEGRSGALRHGDLITIVDGSETTIKTHAAKQVNITLTGGIVTSVTLKAPVAAT